MQILLRWEAGWRKALGEMSIPTRWESKFSDMVPNEVRNMKPRRGKSKRPVSPSGPARCVRIERVGCRYTMYMQATQISVYHAQSLQSHSTRLNVVTLHGVVFAGTTSSCGWLPGSVSLFTGQRVGALPAWPPTTMRG